MRLAEERGREGGGALGGSGGAEGERDPGSIEGRRGGEKRGWSKRVGMERAGEGEAGEATWWGLLREDEGDLGAREAELCGGARSRWGEGALDR